MVVENFDWEQEGNKRLHYLERENADLRREIAHLRKLLSENFREEQWEHRSCRQP